MIAISKTRPTKRKARRTKADIQRLKQAIYDICQKYQPLTVRNLFYRMVVLFLIAKTQNEYKNVTVRLAGIMREAGELPWDWLVDETRWMRKPNSYGSLSGMLDESQKFYRRDVWADQLEYLECWCESASAAGMLYPITSQWDVPLMPAHGFASKSFCWNTAKTIEWHDKPAVILYVGDYDPSGLHIDRDIEAKLRRYAPKADITFKRIAITPEQIAKYNLPSRPPKENDKRAKGFKGGCVEVEALEPDVLREIVGSEIESHIDLDTYNALMAVEKAERKTLETVIAELPGSW